MPTSRGSLTAHFEELVGRAARHLSPDVVRALETAAAEEADAGAKEVLEAILEKAHKEGKTGRGLTSDTGLVTFFVQVGCDFPGLADLGDALHDAVVRATAHEPLAPHSAALAGGDLADNVGAGLPVVHMEVVAGSSDCHVTVLLKGAASEALSALWILPPGSTWDEIGDRLASHIAEGGGRPCPPLIIGVGLGGTPERAVMLSRRALLRPVGRPSPHEGLRAAEAAWRKAIDRTGLGPMGLGGSHTVLAVHAEGIDRHRAFLPVAVSVACWSDRRSSVNVDRHGEVHW